MSHAIEYFEFDVKTSEKEIYAECNEVAAQYGDYGTGLSQKIKFFGNTVYDCREDAEQRIAEIDKPYGCYAVKFYESSNKTPKNIAALEAKAGKAYEAFDELSKKPHYKDAKSQYIGCKTCGSKLSREHLLKLYVPNRCPCCGEDLRPASTLERIEKLRENYQSIQKQLRQAKLENERKNHTDNVKWLVKIEYHC